MIELREIGEDDGLAWARAADHGSGWRLWQCRWGRFRHHWFPGVFGFQIGLGNAILGILRLAVIAAPATVPFIFQNYIGNIGNQVMYMMMVIIFILVISIKIFDWYYDSRKYNIMIDTKSSAYSIRLRNIISNIESNIDKFELSEADKMSMLIDILNCISLKIEEMTNSFRKDYFIVNLLLFESGAEKIYVKERSRRDRLTGVRQPAKATMSYWIAKAGVAWRAVGDVRRETLFAPRGLSSEERDYRSLLLLPVVAGSDGKERCLGIVSIDSGRPYEFTPSNARGFEKQVMPLVKLLAIIVRQSTDGLAGERANGDDG